MLIRKKHPMQGEPRTVERMDRHGKPYFKIRACEPTPGRTRFGDGLAKVVGWGAFGCYAYVLVGKRSFSWEEWAAAGVGAYLLYHMARYTFSQLLYRTTELVMTTEVIRIRGWFLWRGFRRDVEHRFALVPHDLTQDERYRLDYKSRKAGARGKVLWQTVYYGQAFHVVLLHAGHRVDLLEVLGEKQSAAVVARLQYCDARLNEVTGMGNGLPQGPGDDWDEAPGNLRNP